MNFSSLFEAPAEAVLFCTPRRRAEENGGKGAKSPPVASSTRIDRGIVVIVE
jgi:hypothetical protein